ncbi:hypothetical protein N7456_002541 [Penicillium angulare]|uniref:Uncharacterized protein n=1 Tax=Penicillium angulare TaxID=116970 RepID=A0A9W9G9L0_9EURO|nr:hypothetical protein N7456_002541 [Penicillium angulare]
MERYLRSWRQDAFNRGQHESAIYIGDKVLALTNSDSDAFWLAQVHFSNNNFTRALALLSRGDLVSRNPACRYLAAHCYIKQNQFEQALSILGEHNPTDLIRDHNSRRKIQHLNGQSHVTLRNGKAGTGRSERSDERDRERDEDNNVRFEASMCFLRGLCFAKQNAFDRARDCYKDAVRIDYPPPDPSVAQEAADFTKMLYTTRLSKYSSPTILSNATETLSTHYNLSQNPDILLSRAETLYTQCRFAEALELTSSILSTAQSNDLASTNSSGSPTHNHLGHAPGVYPLHLACLYETGATNALFLLSHLLADHAPEEPYTYLAIGVYYLAVSKIAEARRFFSKASLLDPHSAAAWIGFAHTFAAEGEHDQAIAAYSTAARLFQGSHLPQLFLGMQHLALNNMSLAHEYLCAAFSMSTGSAPGSAPTPGKSPSIPLGGDPLVLNELGVVYYHQNNLTPAVDLFRQALTLATSLHCEPGAWVATRANLGHALRRMGNLRESLREFDECLRVGAGGNSMGYSPFLGGGAGGSASVATASGVGGYEDRGLIGSIHTSRGLLLLELGRTGEAVTALHEAVRVLGASGGGDAAGGAGVAGTLLSRALELWALEGREQDRQGLKALEEGNRSTHARGGSSSSRSRDTRTKTRPAEESRRGRGDAYHESWTDEVTHGNTESGELGSVDQHIEMDLDEEADGLLRRALGRVRPGRRRLALPGTPEQQQQQPQQQQMNETPGRRSGHRSNRSQSRQ